MSPRSPLGRPLLAATYERSTPSHPPLPTPTPPPSPSPSGRRRRHNIPTPQGSSVSLSFLSRYPSRPWNLGGCPLFTVVSPLQGSPSRRERASLPFKRHLAFIFLSLPFLFFLLSLFLFFFFLSCCLTLGRGSVRRWRSFLPSSVEFGLQGSAVCVVVGFASPPPLSLS